VHPPLHTLKIWGGGLLPAELGGRVCLFFVCPSPYDARHRKRRRCVYVLNLGGTGISPPDSFSYRSNFRFPSSFRFRSSSSSSSTTSGDIFYCSGSRQLNHSSKSFTYLLTWGAITNVLLCLFCLLITEFVQVHIFTDMRQAEHRPLVPSDSR